MCGRPEDADVTISGRVISRDTFYIERSEPVTVTWRIGSVEVGVKTVSGCLNPRTGQRLCHWRRWERRERRIRIWTISRRLRNAAVIRVMKWGRLTSPRTSAITANAVGPPPQVWTWMAAPYSFMAFVLDTGISLVMLETLRNNRSFAKYCLYKGVLQFAKFLLACVLCESVMSVNKSSFLGF